MLKRTKICTLNGRNLMVTSERLIDSFCNQLIKASLSTMVKILSNDACDWSDEIEDVCSTVKGINSYEFGLTRFYDMKLCSHSIISNSEMFHHSFNDIPLRQLDAWIDTNSYSLLNNKSIIYFLAFLTAEKWIPSTPNTIK